MKAETYPLRTIFGRDVRYVVPLYQRPYVWRRETHWEPLWNDVLSVVQQWPSDTSVDAAEISPHFLGAVVFDQQLTQVGSIEERHIIDGQQRLTTLQLMIAAASAAAQEHGDDRQARLLRKLVFNDSDLVAEPVDVFKVRPTNIDRATYDVVVGGAAHTADGDQAVGGFSLIQEAYEYFRSTIGVWLQEGDEDLPAHLRLTALVESLREFIHIVVIDLEPRDNAQVIFETLNARGTPLLAIDLVKNLLFLRAQDSDQDVGFLYRHHWRGFERAYWREEVRQGRLKKPRAELFLMHWLTMKQKELIGFHHLYPKFRELTLGRPVQEIPQLIAEFSRDGQIFETFDDPEIGTPEHRFFERMKALDTSVLLPLALFLYRQRAGELAPRKRNLALAAVESWIVRRMICGDTVKAYNRLVLDWLKMIEKEPSRAHELIIDTLRQGRAETNTWPSDARLDEALTTLPAYRRLPQGRIRMILTAIENEMRTEKTEEIFVPTAALTLEHVMPQSWETHWPLTDASEAGRDRRLASLHLLGNLTLATRKLNPALSNAPWEEKQRALNAHSVLLLNRELMAADPDRWDEDAIHRRTLKLGRYIKSIWPGPDAEWSEEARSTQLRVQEVSPTAQPSAPPPEALIKRFARGEAQYMMEQLLDEMSLWDDVRVRVGDASRDEKRLIYLSRRGQGPGAFCYLHPAAAEMRLWLDPDEITYMRYAQLADRGNYKVVLSVKQSKVFSEALNLAKLAHDNALRESDTD